MDLANVIKVFIMAIVQGIGEFLPISSSGHLLVLGKLFFSGSGGIDEDELLTLSILLHAGTLLSILVVFRHGILEMLTKNRRLILLLIAGTVPTGIIGVIIKKGCPFLSNSLVGTGVGFLVTGCLLQSFLGKKNQVESNPEKPFGRDNDDGVTRQQKTLRTMAWTDAVIIGIFQGIAVLPGVSRSGLTIVGGILRKMTPADSAVFSFLLAIPAIAGAAVLEMYEFTQKRGGDLWDSAFSLYFCGALVSFVVGLVSLAYLMKWLRQGKLSWFAWWLFFIGTVSVIWGICS